MCLALAKNAVEKAYIGVKIFKARKPEISIPAPIQNRKKIMKPYVENSLKRSFARGSFYSEIFIFSYFILA